MSKADDRSQRYYYFVAYQRIKNGKREKSGYRFFNSTTGPEGIDDKFLDEIVATIKGADADSEILITAFNRL